MHRNKFLIVNGGTDYGQMFAGLGERSYDLVDFQAANVIVFTGGADVSPNLYNEKDGFYTIPDVDRDTEELCLFEEAVNLGKHIVGICRGAQLGCVLSGGTLLQHVTNHINTTHRIYTSEGDSIHVAGDHHQMMMPYEMSLDEYDLLAWSYNLSTSYLDGTNNMHPYLKKHRAQFLEPEMVYFKNTGCLAVQYHPEWMSPQSEGYAYFLRNLKIVLGEQNGDRKFGNASSI